MLCYAMLCYAMLCYAVGFPDSSRTECVQCVLLLLPDCNREALHSLLYFLQGVTLSHLSNKVTRVSQWNAIHLYVLSVV